MKNNTLVQLSLFVAAALLLGACGSPATDKNAELAKLKEKKTQIEAQIAALEKEVGAPAAPQKVHTVSLTELQPAPFRHFIDIQGKVDAEENVPVTAKAPGVLSKVLVKNGDVVKRGQLLAIIDDQLMLKGLAELELQLQTATDLFNRQKALWDQKIGTEVQFIQAKTNKEAIEQRIATTKEQWQMTRIYAPISGSVDYVMLKAGQAISPGIPLCNIVNLSDLKITGEVPEAYAAKVTKGDAVVLYFP
ncbi:MAG TPA: efflux RND transporter periplasmic adaptor subunit, partial [Saprospiraceae bacterium]|nr:efflux RND transporter periplasmic adaptor subunit [Saprospiraceae bacterium]